MNAVRLICGIYDLQSLDATERKNLLHEIKTPDDDITIEKDARRLAAAVAEMVFSQSEPEKHLT